MVNKWQHRVLLHEIFDMQLLLPPPADNFEAQVMHWLLSLKIISLASNHSVHKSFRVNIMHHAALYGAPFVSKLYIKQHAGLRYL